MIGDITENQSFETESVLHYHGWVTRHQILFTVLLIFVTID